MTGRTVTVTVDVRDHAGRPIAGVRVWFTRAPVATADLAALTGDDGRAVLGAPAAGEYEVCVVGDDATVTREVRVDRTAAHVTIVV